MNLFGANTGLNKPTTGNSLLSGGSGTTGGLFSNLGGAGTGLTSGTSGTTSNLFSNPTATTGLSSNTLNTQPTSLFAGNKPGGLATGLPGANAGTATLNPPASLITNTASNLTNTSVSGPSLFGANTSTTSTPALTAATTGVGSSLFANTPLTTRAGIMNPATTTTTTSTTTTAAPTLGTNFAANPIGLAAPNAATGVGLLPTTVATTGVPSTAATNALSTTAPASLATDQAIEISPNLTMDELLKKWKKDMDNQMVSFQELAKTMVKNEQDLYGNLENIFALDEVVRNMERDYQNSENSIKYISDQQNDLLLKLTQLEGDLSKFVVPNQINNGEPNALTISEVIQKSRVLCADVDTLEGDVTNLIKELNPTENTDAKNMQHILNNYYEALVNIEASTFKLSREIDKYSSS